MDKEPVFSHDGTMAKAPLKPVRELRRTTPLVSLTALVLDTETTGLNTQTDRVVQFGALAMTDGKCDYEQAFDELVNPGIPIPAASTEVHGIYDRDVASADDFATVFERLNRFHPAPMIIGYSIGFDLAVLKAEHERLGTQWEPPPSLDVQLLGQIVAPELPDRSMDTLAAWLGVTTEGRHNALADAVIAARIFKALVPKLAEKSIFTYAEIQRAINRISIPAATASGWHDIRDESKLNVRAVNEYARIDSFPYRHTIRELMRAPPVIIPATSDLNSVLALMTAENVTSVFVDPGNVKDGRNFGIFTSKDLLGLIAKSGVQSLSFKVGDHCNKPLIGVAASDHLYKAIAKLASLNISHLAVFDPSMNIIGAITNRDLLRQRSQDASILGDNIEKAKSPEELATIWPHLTGTARGLVYEQVDARNVASIISHELRALTRRACELAIEEMKEKGKGDPPAKWAMMVLGSGGRGESLLAMDQDNAIIYEKGEPGGETDQWFEEMGSRATMILHEVGVPLCKGNIMASNPEWRMNASLWRERIGHWISRSKPQDILNADIFFDAASVHGDPELLDALETDALEAASGSRNFIQLLSMNAANFPDSVGWFGKLKTENGRMDIKRAGLMPIFSTARVLAITHQIKANATPDRLNAARPHSKNQGSYHRQPDRSASHLS